MDATPLLLNDAQRQALADLRAFLDKCWNWSQDVYYNTGFRRKEQRPDIACTYMCRHTSLFVMELLKPIDNQWKVVQGTLAPADGTAPQVYYWLENDQCRVDLTAEQFGWEPIVVTSLEDARYVRDMQAKPAKASVVKTTLEQWRGISSRDWMDNNPGFQAIQANQAALVRFQQAWQNAAELNTAAAPRVRKPAMA